MTEINDRYDIRGKQVVNRFVRSATAERTADPEGGPGASILPMYSALASGGAGIIITGHVSVNRHGRVIQAQPVLDSDSFIPAWRLVTSAVRDVVPKSSPSPLIPLILMQISHGGRQVSAKAVPEVLAPSALQEPVTKNEPRAMTEDEIVRTIKDFAEAARRAKAAGFDGVQIHAAHGYLISEFLSPRANQRTDSWGGSPDGMSRILVETVKAVRAAVGDSFIMAVKLNCDDGVDGGFGIEEAVSVSAWIVGEGVDAIEVSGGSYEASVRRSTCRVNINQPAREAYFLQPALAIKKAVGSKAAVIAVGGFRTVDVVRSALASGVDFVSMCRPFVREPDIASRFIDGSKQASDCVSCNGCLMVKEGLTRCVKLQA